MIPSKSHLAADTLTVPGGCVSNMYSTQNAGFLRHEGLGAAVVVAPAPLARLTKESLRTRLTGLPTVLI